MYSSNTENIFYSRGIRKGIGRFFLGRIRKGLFRKDKEGLFRKDKEGLFRKDK